MTREDRRRELNVILGLLIDAIGKIEAYEGGLADRDVMVTILHELCEQIKEAKKKG